MGSVALEGRDGRDVARQFIPRPDHKNQPPHTRSKSEDFADLSFESDRSAIGDFERSRQRLATGPLKREQPRLEWNLAADLRADDDFDLGVGGIAPNARLFAFGALGCDPAGDLEFKCREVSDGLLRWTDTWLYQHEYCNRSRSHAGPGDGSTPQRNDLGRWKSRCMHMLFGRWSRQQLGDQRLAPLFRKRTKHGEVFLELFGGLMLATRGNHLGFGQLASGKCFPRRRAVSEQLTAVTAQGLFDRGLLHREVRFRSRLSTSQGFLTAHRRTLTHL